MIGHHGHPNEIDSGMRVTIKDSTNTTTYAIIYAAPSANPPAGFRGGYEYYYVVAAIPSTATSLSLIGDRIGGSNPGFSATEAKMVTPVGFVRQGSAPASAATLWVATDTLAWAFDWQVSGTFTRATGTVAWWNSSSALLAPTGTHVMRNNTSTASTAVYRAIDTL